MNTMESYGGLDEPRTDVRRYLSALRRSRVLITLIVIVITGAAVGFSLVLPKTYESTATIVVDVENALLGLPDAESQQRRLSTLDELIGSPRVLTPAARRLGGVSADELADKVDASVDPQANLIDIKASDRSPERAAQIANAVATAFLTEQRALEQARLQGAIDRVQAEIERLSAAGGDQQGLAQLNERISTLRSQQAGAGSELQVAARAEAPNGPASPKPVRNGILAFFAALFLGVLVALARDQLRPTITTPRELSRLTGHTVLAGIPYIRRRFARHRQLARAIEHDGYQKLAAEIQLALPPEQTHTILVTSAVHAEGKTTVTERLGRVLAEAGHNTLLITGDTRWPQLHAAFDLPAAPGLTDVLKRAQVKKSGFKSELVSVLHGIDVFSEDRRRAGRLCVLTPGSKPSNPAQLFSSNGLHVLFGSLRVSPFKYVLIDTPPALGMADVQRLAQEADELLWVSRLDRLTLENVADMQDLLERLPVRPLGHVVIGASVDVSPYYLSARPGIVPPPDEPEPSEARTTPGD